MRDINKLARPLVTYVGLSLFVLNYTIPLICRMFGKNIDPVNIPSEFIVGWFAFLSTYSLGRSVEKLKGVISENK